ncbi:MAG: hypothetical protein K2W88_08115 [Pararheinheimera sp.]|nr:hypothetical protein [Rheinheimera sp.]
MLPTFDLGDKFLPESLAGFTFKEAPHGKIAGATVYTVEVMAGDILLITFGEVLHEIVYQTPSWFPWTRKRKLRKLFKSYSNGHDWAELMDNGFGKVFRRSDKMVGALTSRLMDYTTFHTEFWRSQKW